MKAEAQALRLLAKKDRAGLEALVLASRRALAALDVLEGVSPVELVEEPAAPRAPMTDAERSREYRKRHAPPSRERDASSRSPSRSPSRRRDAGRDAGRDAERASGVTLEGGAGGVGLGISGSLGPISEETNTENSENTAGGRASTVTTSVTLVPSRANPDYLFDGTADAFCRVVANGGRHTGLSGRERIDLEQVLMAHAPGLQGADRVEWVTKNTAEYCKATDANFWRRKPAKLGEWLNAGKPSRPGTGAPRMVQKKNEVARGDLETETLLEVGNG